MFATFVNGFVQRFTTHGRFADLILGTIVVALGFWWHSWVTIALGAVSLVAFATDFNGMVQRRMQAWAHGQRAKRMQARR